MRSPSIFAWFDPKLVQVASNFFHTLIVVQRVHCSEKHGLPVPLRLLPRISPPLILECTSETVDEMDSIEFARSLKWCMSSQRLQSTVLTRWLALQCTRSKRVDNLLSIHDLCGWQSISTASIWQWECICSGGHDSGGSCLWASHLEVFVTVIEQARTALMTWSCKTLHRWQVSVWLSLVRQSHGATIQSFQVFHSQQLTTVNAAVVISSFERFMFVGIPPWSFRCA